MGFGECKYDYCWLNNISITQNVNLAFTSEETNYGQLKRADILHAFFHLLNVNPRKNICIQNYVI